MSRFHYLDFSRSVLFTSGIVLHAAWLYQGQSHILAGTHDFIHSFRMEAFFILAGFFAGFMLAKYSPEEFFIRRITKLGIPLLLFGFFIDQIVNCEDVRRWSDFSVILNRNYWIDTRWLHHLWFLSVLIQYVVLLFAAAKLCPLILTVVTRHRIALPGLFLIVSVGYVLCVHIPPGPRFLERLVFVRLSDTVHYSVFFGVGYYFFHNQELLERLTNRPILNLISVVVFLLALPHLAALGHDSILQICHSIYILSLCGLLFWVARRYFATRNEFIGRFSDASFTIYLSHWPLMILFYRWLQPLNVSFLVAFPLIIVLTLTASYLLHVCVVTRFGIAAALINGEFRKKEASIGRLQIAIPIRKTCSIRIS